MCKGNISFPPLVRKTWTTKYGQGAKYCTQIRPLASMLLAWPWPWRTWVMFALCSMSNHDWRPLNFVLHKMILSTLHDANWTYCTNFVHLPSQCDLHIRGTDRGLVCHMSTPLFKICPCCVKDRVDKMFVPIFELWPVSYGSVSCARNFNSVWCEVISKHKILSSHKLIATMFNLLWGVTVNLEYKSWVKSLKQMIQSEIHTLSFLFAALRYFARCVQSD